MSYLGFPQIYCCTRRAVNVDVIASQTKTTPHSDWSLLTVVWEDKKRGVADILSCGDVLDDNAEEYLRSLKILGYVNGSLAGREKGGCRHTVMLSVMGVEGKGSAIDAVTFLSPFTAAVCFQDVDAKTTGTALPALHKFIVYDFIGGYDEGYDSYSMKGFPLSSSSDSIWEIISMVAQ